MRYWRFFRWLDEIPERRKYKGLPRGCWHCEVLGLCRKPIEKLNLLWYNKYENNLKLLFGEGVINASK